MASIKCHVNAHSMGAYLFIRARAAYSRIDAVAEPKPGSFLIDELTFFAADVSDAILERGEDGYHAVAETLKPSALKRKMKPAISTSKTRPDP